MTILLAASRSVCIAVVASMAMGCGDQRSTPADTISEIHIPFDLAAMRKLIEAKNIAFTQAHITGDSAVLIDYFTADTRVLGPNAEAVVGRAAIAELNAQYVDYGIKEFTEVTTNFYGDENYLIDEGTYFMRYGEDVVEEGKYLNVWKQVDGEWRVCANMWNTNK